MPQDLRYALRQFLKDPGFSATAVLILAVGIAFSLALFEFVDAALIRPLPYANPAQLMYVTGSVTQFPRARLSYLDFLEIKRSNSVFKSMDVYSPVSVSIRTPSGPMPVNAIEVSNDFLRTLGTAPMLGRDFVSDDAKAVDETILSYASWKTRFGGRSDIIGQTVQVGGNAATVIGVLPPNFEFAPGEDAEFWLPLDPASGCLRVRGCHNLQAIARLNHGITPTSAAAEMKTIAARLEREYPATDRGQGILALPLTEVIVGDIRPVLLVLLSAAGLLLLVGCINIATLLLVRSESRKREIAIRRALGASSKRIVSQFATEALLLVSCAGILALLPSAWGMRLLLSLIPTDMIVGMPYLLAAGFDVPVTIYVLSVLLVSWVLLAFVPSVRLVSGPLPEGLAEGGHSSTSTLWRGFGQHLVRFELAIGVVLLVCAGLLGKSFYRLVHVDVGFQADHLAVLQLGLASSNVSSDLQRIALQRELVNRISNAPGVASVAITDRLPLSGSGNTEWIRFAGRPYSGEHNEVNERKVSSGYLSTLKATMLRGRTFSDDEDHSKPGVVIINQALARKYFGGGEDPIGKIIGDNDLSPGSLKQIIGIVDNIREGTLDSEDLPTVYWPFNQSVPHGNVIDIVVRTSQAEQAILAELTRTIHAVNPDLSIMASQTMNDRIYGSKAAYLHRSSTWLMGGFAVGAFLLGVIGLYGVISYSVARRTREIGLRMALGAQRSAVYRLILSEALSLSAVGVVVGLLLAVGVGSLIRKLLFATPAWDVLTLIAVAGVFGTSALLASYIPARRAATVEPVEALRQQ